MASDCIPHRKALLEQEGRHILIAPLMASDCIPHRKALLEQEGRHILRAVDETNADGTVPLPAWVRCQERIEQAWQSQSPEVAALSRLAEL